MDNFNFAELLRQYREQNGYSVREMAEILHMSKSAYDRLEKGLTSPTYEQIQRILKLLHIESDTIREIDNGRKPGGTISYLKRSLLYGSISTDVALNSLADIADAIDDADMLEWAKVESKGYHRSKRHLPPYRWIDIIYEMECEHDGRKFFLNLPSEFVSDEENLDGEAYEGGVEHMDSHWPHCAGKISGLYEDTQRHLEYKLQEIYGPDLKLIRAIGDIPPESMYKILLAVQEIILRFVLAVETEIGPNLNTRDLKMHKHLIGKLFREAMDKIGEAKHLELPVKPTTPITKIVKNDVENFVDWLVEHNISTYEMDEFYVLIDTLEGSTKSDGIVPPEMCAWAKKVTSSNARFREDQEKLINGLKVFYGVMG